MKKYLKQDPDVLGGELVIVGTRIPITRILYLLRDGYTLETIHEDYKQVEFSILKKAVDEAIAMLGNQSDGSQVSQI